MDNGLEKVKEQFAEAARRAYQRGIQTGNGGNISARVPGEPLMVVKPSGVSLLDCTPETVIVTDFDGNLVEGNRKPTRESLLHGELYKNLSKVGGVVHCHSPWAIAWSFTGRDLPLLTLHAQLKLGTPIPVRFFSSPKGVLKEEMPAVLGLFEAQPDLSAFIMGAHGVVAVGPDVLEAEHTAELIEETAQVAYLHALGSRLQLLPEAPRAAAKGEADRVRDDLVACGRAIAAKGLVVGPGGNLSARVRETMYISASGSSFGEATPEDYVGVDIATGRVVDGAKQPSSEVLMHLACYRRRPDVQAVVHTHPTMVTAVASSGRKLEVMFPDYALFLREVAHLDYVVPTTRELAQAVEQVIGGHDAVAMANHGALTVGASLKEALLRTELLEEGARIMVAACTVGVPRALSKREVEAIHNLASEKYRRVLMG